MRVNLTIPVFNEEDALAPSIEKLALFLKRHVRFQYEVVIANNGSTDNTLLLAQDLARTYEFVYPFDTPIKGRGHALKKVWSMSSCDVMTYMDVDLSTDISVFPPMVESLISGGFDLATASRLLKPSMTKRSLRREICSRCYNFLIKSLFRTGFSDAQCGFKGITRSAACRLLPLIENENWFFDTELLILAEKLGLRIFDFPAQWKDDSGSQVKILQTVIEDLRGLTRLYLNFSRGVYEQNGRAIRP